DLPDPEFVAELRRLNGTPREVLEHPELMELMIPILRADFEVSETYSYEERLPLPVGLTAFGGLQDEDVPLSEVELWSEQTSGRFAAHMLPGDHFFLHASEKSLLHLIGRDIDLVLNT
ncbi:MAG: thioesterase domain-containing protein, partial [Acidobacteriota bacterium]